LFPNIKHLLLNLNEKKFLNSQLHQLTNDAYKSTKNILKFYKKYWRVYIKYKHIFNALLGSYSVKLDTINKKKIVSSQIFIRDYNKRFSTYILPTTTLDSVNYYQDIIDDISNIFHLLVISYLSSMANLGKPFIVPILKQNDFKTSNKLTKIIQQINYYPLPFIPVNTNIVFPEKLSMNIIKKSQKDKIFKMNGDIFDYRQKQIKKKI